MNNSKTSYKYFCELAGQFQTVPVYQRILADMLTPVAAFNRLIHSEDYGFIFESVEKGSYNARHSYIGVNPTKILIHNSGTTIIKSQDKTVETKKPFLEILREYQSKYKMNKLSDLPSFTGGLVGYFGYETVQWAENIDTYPASKDDIPDAIFMLFEELIAFDHLNGSALVFSNVNVDKSKNLKDQFEAAHKRIDQIGEKLHTEIDYQVPSKKPLSKLKSNFTKNQFKEAVKTAKNYIREGDIFQLVISQCFQRDTSAEPLTVYRALRSINPSPYMFHLKLKDFDIIGASPEILVKVQDEKVTVRPIAGTRPRGKDESEDTEIAQELLKDPKELAEHLMLLDLGRNDVGKIAEFGSIEIPEKMIVENYSHVMHIVSSVEGKLKSGNDIFDALQSGFPAGTVTGAPKIRAMNIIHELEPQRRNIYSGAIGYMDFCGNLNTCIAIRTMLIKQGRIQFQSGAGIVIDSDPEKEFEETRNKAKAIMTAIDMAENGLVLP